MTRGKYAIRAANRLAELDNNIIRDLRDQLANREKELRDTKIALGEACREIASQAMNEARRLADEEIKRCHDQLAAAQQEHRTHIEALCFDLLDLYYEHGCQAPSPAAVEAFNIQYAELFGMGGRYAELVQYIRDIRGVGDADADIAETGYMCEAELDDDESPEDYEGEGARQLNRWEKRFTSSTRKVRRANSIVRQMRSGKGAIGPTQHGRGIGYANGTWGYAEKEIPR